MAIAIYTRQSLDKKESISIETQIDLCKKECKSEDEILIYKDKGYSGKNIDRPDMQRMLEDIESGKIQKVICYRLDRLSRSILDFSNIWSLLDAHKVSFSSVNEKFDTDSPVGRAMIYIIMVFAQLERETIAERVRDNYYKRIEKGSWPGGPAPYGYNIGRKCVDGKFVPTLVPDEKLEIVKYIFRRYLEKNVSLGQIAKELSDNNIEGMRRRSWDNVALARILHSPLYVKADINVYSYYKEQGVLEFINAIEEFDGTVSANLIGKKVSNSKSKFAQLSGCIVVLTNFDGIISSSEWLAVQDKLSRNRQITNSNRGANTWLVGLLKCKKCNYSLVIKKWMTKKSGLKESLYCTGHSSLHICDVDKFSVNYHDIENAVEKELVRILDEENKMHDDEFVEDKDVALIRLEIIKIENKIERLIKNMMESDEVVGKYINDKIIKLDKEKNELESQVEKKRQKIKRQVKNILFSELSNEDKNIVACSFVEKILVGTDEVEIIWKI